MTSLYDGPCSVIGHMKDELDVAIAMARTASKSESVIAPAFGSRI